jgi:hypothetical protein
MMKTLHLFNASRLGISVSVILLLVFVPQIALAEYAVFGDEMKRADVDGEMKPGSSHKKIGISFMIFGGSVAAVGAGVKFGEDVEGPDYKEDEYNTFNYAMMIGGAAVFVLGTVFLISRYEASRVRDRAYIDCDREVTRVGVGFSF